VEQTKTDARSDEITLVASDIQENRKQPFLERRAIPLKNLGRRGLNKFWDVEVGVLEDG
jgi:hypothetical protein